jgi:hypothetical protein
MVAELVEALSTGAMLAMTLQPRHQDFHCLFWDTPLFQSILPLQIYHFLKHLYITMGFIKTPFISMYVTTSDLSIPEASVHNNGVCKNPIYFNLCYRFRFFNS